MNSNVVDFRRPPDASDPTPPQDHLRHVKAAGALVRKHGPATLARAGRGIRHTARFGTFTLLMVFRRPIRGVLRLLGSLLMLSSIIALGAAYEGLLHTGSFANFGLKLGAVLLAGISLHALAWGYDTVLLRLAPPNRQLILR